MADRLGIGMLEQFAMFGEVVDRTEEMPNDRYTTKPTLEWCKRVLGVDGFDLDVAACLESHKAPLWFGRAHPMSTDVARVAGHRGKDGLAAPWNAARVWCNPPYDDLEPWVAKAWSTMFEGAVLRAKGALALPIIGVLIPDNRREQPFWQRLIEPWRDGRWERPNHPHRSQALPMSMIADNYGQIAVAHDAGARLFTHSLPGRQPFGVPGNPEGVGQQSPPFGVVLLEFRFEETK